MRKDRPLTLLLTLIIPLIWVVAACSNTSHPLTVEEFWSRYPVAAPSDERQAFFNFVADSLEQGYAYHAEKQASLGFRWSDLRAHYAEAITKVETEAEFLFLLDEMVSLLDDSHTSITADIELKRTAEVILTEEQGSLRLAAFSPRIAEAVPALEPGAEVLTIDGTPAMDLYQRLLKSTPYGQMQDGGRLLMARFLPTYYFYEARRQGDGRLTLQVATPAGPAEFSMPWAGNAAKRLASTVPLDDTFASRMLDDQIGYIRIPRFSGDGLVDQIDQAFADLTGARALVIDVRENTGGDFATLGSRVLRHLVTERVLLGSSQFRYSDHLHLFGQEAGNYPGRPEEGAPAFSDPTEMWLEPLDSPRERPLLILTTERCASSTDLFVGAVHDLGLGRIVGRMDPLHSGQPIQIAFPAHEGWGLRFSVMIARGASGEMAEGRSVAPEIPVPLSRAEILGQEDPILMAALSALAR